MSGVDTSKCAADYALYYKYMGFKNENSEGYLGMNMPQWGMALAYGLGEAVPSVWTGNVLGDVGEITYDAAGEAIDSYDYAKDGGNGTFSSGAYAVTNSIGGAAIDIFVKDPILNSTTHTLLDAVLRKIWLNEPISEELWQTWLQDASIAPFLP